jgi:hypothetical protein
MRRFQRAGSIDHVLIRVAERRSTRGRIKVISGFQIAEKTLSKMSAVLAALRVAQYEWTLRFAFTESDVSGRIDRDATSRARRKLQTASNSP